MAGNKFATMLHRNTHMIAVVLVYTLLEWVLIGLLLLNAIFFYLISRYVAFFGLKPPCLLCTRVDHLLDPHAAHPYSIVCDDHADEITKRGNRDRSRKDEKKAFGGSGMCEDGLVETRRGRSEGVELLDHGTYGKHSTMGMGMGMEVEGGFGVGKAEIGGKELEVEKRARDALTRSLDEHDEEEEEDDETEEEDDDKDDETEEEDDEEERVDGAEEEKGGADNGDDRENRGSATAADNEHMFKHGSCKRVYGSDTIYKILNHHHDATSPVIERVYKVEPVHFRKEEVRSRDGSEADDRESEEGTLGKEGGVVSDGGTETYVLEIEDRAFFTSEKRKCVVLSSITLPEDQSKQKGEKEGETVAHSPSDGLQTKPRDSSVGNGDGKNRLSSTLSDVWDQIHTTSLDTSAAIKVNVFSPVLEKLHESTTAVGTTDDLQEKVSSCETFQATCDNNAAFQGTELPGAPGATHITADSSLATPDAERSRAPREPEITLDREERVLQKAIADLVTEAVMDGELRGTKALENNDKINGETKLGEAELNHLQRTEPLSQVPVAELHDKNEFEAEDDGRTVDRANRDVLSGSEVCEREQINYSEDQERISRVETSNLHNESAQERQAYEGYKSEGKGASEVSDGSEIHEKEGIDHVGNQVAFPSTEQFQSRQEETQDNMQVHEATRTSRHLSVLPEHDELEEHISPERADGIFNINKKGMLDRRESLTESMDGSVASEADSTEILTTDQLKSALKAERKALTALYAELDEERNASAISAHQTMAMITRLQEEKATMRMEALQYQRMMEEQSEYDQDALHILDDLAKKREREKQELMKELETYREKVRIYEAKEGERMRQEKGDHGSDSALPSGDDEVERPSLDHNELDDNAVGQLKDSSTADISVFSSGNEHGKTKLSTLNEELEALEEERVHILEQLKSSEEKLFALDDIGESTENINDKNNEGDHSRDPVSVLTSERERLAIAEEMDNLYQRLHALEEDKTLVKQCINSLKKGDKETDLLGEIFEHLRSLRNSEEQARNPRSQILGDYHD